MLVPGTGGTKLELDGVDIGYPMVLRAAGLWASTDLFPAIQTALGRSAEQITEILSMEHADPHDWNPTRTTMLSGASVAPGQALMAAYNQFSDYEVFSYDWRADIRASARRLLDHLREHTPAGAKWRLLGHSQGGLVIIVASKLAALEYREDPNLTSAENADRRVRAFAELVSHAVLLGTPIHGTVDAAAALLRGEDMGAGFSKHFRKISRTWPSLYQMLPAWRDTVLISGGGQPTKAGHSLLHSHAWPADSIDPALLVRARETRREFFESPFTFLQGLKLRALMSMAHPTWCDVVWDGQTYAFPEESGGRFQRGDTLVPYDVTLRLTPKAQRQYCLGIGENEAVAIHYLLANDPTFATAIKQELG